MYKRKGSNDEINYSKNSVIKSSYSIQFPWIKTSIEKVSLKM